MSFTFTLHTLAADRDNDFGMKTFQGFNRQRHFSTFLMEMDMEMEIEMATVAWIARDCIVFQNIDIK